MHEHRHRSGEDEAQGVGRERHVLAAEPVGESPCERRRDCRERLSDGRHDREGRHPTDLVGVEGDREEDRIAADDRCGERELDSPQVRVSEDTLDRPRRLGDLAFSSRHAAEHRIV